MTQEPRPQSEVGQKRESSGWQPIETAPHQQTVLIYYKNELGKGRTIKAVYYPRWTVESNKDEDTYDEYSEEKDEYFVCEGWYEQIDNWPEYTEVHVNEGQPTHWMPLPDAPTTQIEDDKAAMQPSGGDNRAELEKVREALDSGNKYRDGTNGYNRSQEKIVEALAILDKMMKGAE